MGHIRINSVRGKHYRAYININRQSHVCRRICRTATAAELYALRVEARYRRLLQHAEQAAQAQSELAEASGGAVSRNGNRITNYYNVIAACEDWKYVAAKAIAFDRADLVAANMPAPEAGWRRIDKCTAAIRAELGWPDVDEMRKAHLAQKDGIK